MAVITFNQTDNLLLRDGVAATKILRGGADILLLDETLFLQVLRPMLSYEIHPHAHAKDVIWVRAQVAGNPPGGGT